MATSSSSDYYEGSKDSGFSQYEDLFHGFDSTKTSKCHDVCQGEFTGQDQTEPILQNHWSQKNDSGDGPKNCSFLRLTSMHLRAKTRGIPLDEESANYYW